ncbi:MAG TPA: hypothetical protein VHE56_07665 [Mycobacteriales bacterium]|nr:hypothetical protein [Mycobacteriales bacterium]
MQTGEPLDPPGVAAAIAPIIDRLRIAIVRAVGPMESEVAERLGVPAPVLRLLGMLRNTTPDRIVSIADVLEVFLYQPPEQIRAAIDGLVRAGLAEMIGDEDLRLAKSAQVLVHEVLGRMQTVLEELWSDQAELVARLLPIAQRACAAVTASGGAATRIMAPPYQAPDSSPALLLAESLTPLRFHRFDAYAAAWRAEGLTVAAILQLPAGPQRQRIEDETNRLSAPPYAVLSDAERFTLVTGLGALPN